MNIIITGASRGIGYETAKTLSSTSGHKIFAISRNIDGLRQLSSECEEIGEGSSMVYRSFDLVSGNIEHDLLPELKGIMKNVDVLINNAGYLVNRPFHELSTDDFDQMFNTNVKSVFMLVKALLPLFPKGAHIINIASMGGYQGSVKFPGLSLYSASKAALAVLTECLAEEFKPRDIRVNCLALGSVRTDMLEEAFPDYDAPLSASEMASFIAEFSLTGQKYFNGKIIPVSVTTP